MPDRNFSPSGVVADHRLRRFPLACSLLCCALGCNDGAHTRTDDTGLTGLATAGEGDATAGDSDDDGGADEAEGRLDVADGATPGGGDDGGHSDRCHKIDFLFVVDDSASMTEHQDQLIAAFPQFMAAIQSDVEVEDFHIMVVDSSAGDERYEQCERLACGADGGRALPDFYCRGYECGSYAQNCNTMLGGGVVEVFGAQQRYEIDRHDCGPLDGGRFLTSNDPDMVEKFKCIADVGEGGSTEYVMRAAVAAVSEEMQAPGGCNEGFLRDDALLVVTFLSNATQNEDGGLSEQINDNPQDWVQALVDAKHGNKDAINVIGLLPDFGFGPEAVCEWELAYSEPFRDFVESFGEHGTWSSICGNDYTATFADAIGRIDSSCNDFVPAG